MSEPGLANAHARKTVLIVDDDEGTLRVLEHGISTILDMFDVLSASDGREAIELMERNHVDALVTDLAMPVMDGFALIAYVTNLERALPVVVLSGMASSAIGERLSAYGGLRVLGKPSSYHEVAESLLAALEHVALGHVEGIPLPGVLQLVESERRSCTVVVTSGRRKGRLSFQSGRLIDAFSEDFGADGEAAAYDILGWDDTSIAFEHLPDNARQTIHTPMQLMLIEVAVTQDAVRERTLRSMPAAATIEFATTDGSNGETSADPAAVPAVPAVPHANAEPSPPAAPDLSQTQAPETRVPETRVPETQRPARRTAPPEPPASEPAAPEPAVAERAVARAAATVQGPNGSHRTPHGVAHDTAHSTSATDPDDGGTTMPATDTHVSTLLGAVERLTERVRDADAALAAVAAEVEAFREAQRAFDEVAEQRERRRLELEAFRADVASLARQILGRVDGMFSPASGPAATEHGAAATDAPRSEAGTSP